MKYAFLFVIGLCLSCTAYAQDVPYEDRTPEYYESRAEAQLESILAEYGFDDESTYWGAWALYWYKSSPCGQKMIVMNEYIDKDIDERTSAEEKRINTARIAHLVKTHICSSDALKSFAKTHRPETDEELQDIRDQWGVKWDKSQDDLRMKKRKKGK